MVFRKLFLASPPRWYAVLACAMLTACSALPGQQLGQQPSVLLLGEQHDAPSHPGLHAKAVRDLIAQRRLGALVLEMSDAPARTSSLGPQATEQAVQTALGWKQAAWPWANYQGAIMAAVRAGVPVVGGNLPPAKTGQAMQSANYEGLFTPALWQRHLDNIRTGHCDMLPASQLAPMARVQVARDVQMASVVLSEVTLSQSQNKTIVLIAGSGHIDEKLAVPFHIQQLNPGTAVQVIQWPGESTGTDYCAQFKQQMQNMGKPVPAK
jgi:uncharacterized iron-regulated protein